MDFILKNGQFTFRFENDQVHADLNINLNFLTDTLYFGDFDDGTMWNAQKENFYNFNAFDIYKKN